MEIQEECNLLGMASHPFVLQLVKSFQSPGHVINIAYRDCYYCYYCDT